MPNALLELCNAAAPVITVATAVTGAIVGLRTYVRSQAWKRTEFIAAETKALLADPRVTRTLLMIDWDARIIRLYDEKPPRSGCGLDVPVTRQMQTAALKPETVAGVYSDAEAAIRDCYDTLLDGLERLAHHVEVGLIPGRQLQPYIRYWIGRIAEAPDNPLRADWAATLVTYIAFYRYSGVQRLFRDYGCDIRPGTSGYLRFLRLMPDQELASALAASVKVPYPYSVASGKSSEVALEGS